MKDSDILSQEALVELVTTEVERVYRVREAEIGPEMFHRLERWIMLGLEWEGGGFRGINQLWREHLLNMDHLKEGIGLRGYGQRDPLTEYKKEAFDIFQEMIEHLKEVVVEQLFKVRSHAGGSGSGQDGAGSASCSPVALAGESRQQSRLIDAGGARAGPLRHARRAPHGRWPEGRPQRSVPLRLGQEVQEVLPLERRLERKGPICGRRRPRASTLNVQRVRLAGGHRAPPRSWTLLIALAVLRQASSLMSTSSGRWPRPP